jgi:transposase
MNAHLAKWIMYHEVHRMHREGYSISKINDLLGLHRNTIRKYLSMREADYEALLIKQSERRKELDPYEEFVKDRLRLYPETSAAQMHDWLKEHHSSFPNVNPKTIFNFVHWIRNKYNIPKLVVKRQHQVIEELPYGKQAQVDFGQYNMRTSTGKRAKVFFFTFVLSRSRYKYLWFTDRYFTTDLAIQAHELAFGYINGVPDEIVYDQDKVFIVTENSGDIILADLFRNYIRSKTFTLHFCRKSDPQSKGKVENAVKYVKQNFLYNRTYYNIETLNDEALGWLGRTANMIPHNFTQKVPHSEWIIERPFLQKHVDVPQRQEAVLYTVRKDNTISFKSNLYSLPLGTYAGRGTQVSVMIEHETLQITSSNGEAICSHRLSLGKGLKIVNTDHKRDKTTAIDQLIENVSLLSQVPDQAKEWLKTIYAAKPRYVRDQLLLIKKAIESNDSGLVSQTIKYCLSNKITSAVDFDAIIKQHHRTATSSDQKVIPLNPLSGHHLNNAMLEPQKSSITDYQNIVKKSSK